MKRLNTSTNTDVVWEEARIRETAARQHGLIDRLGALQLGATDHEISMQIGRGRLQVLHSGVYYLNCTQATWKTDVLAAVLAAGPAAVASHRCAARLWKLDAVYGQVIEVTVPYLESPEPDGAIVHRTRRRNPSTVGDGIPITTPEKTLLDIAPLVPRRTLWKAARSAILQQVATVDSMDSAVAAYGGRGVSGTKRMREIVRLVADDESGSPAEIDLQAMVEGAPIPPPVQQLQIRRPDGTNAYPDFAWPDRLRIVEVDGFGAHGTPEQLEEDLRRQNDLMDLGWDIRRFTPARIREEPAVVEAELVRFVNRPFREDLSRARRD